MLDKEFEYYRTHQEELLRKYSGKFVVIHGNEVVGSYDTEAEAYREAQKGHSLGTFLIQQCTPGEEGYTQAFHSRVAL